MNLVLDIGNTRVKSAVFNQYQLIKNDVFEFNRETILELIRHHQGKVIISSVLKDESLKIPDFKHIFRLSNHTRLPLKNGYETPETLGNDRLANAVAIHHLATGRKALAIDCGTCLKFDLVINDEYLGGSIGPGLTMRFNAVHTFTGKLPFISPDKFDQLNGLNTRDSILSGCYRGMLAEIRQTLSDYESRHGNLEIFMTGGDHLFFADHFKNRIFADPFLTLKGLNEILNFQND